ncbi:portal protein [Labrys sp. KB_33_2]|uniref:portal protein n=1 Tax=Labrys sp. KB_33_2 TaxID=3237479 RepID=UPI003F90DA1B
MSIENDLVQRLDALANQRTQWEAVWQEIATYCLPDTHRFLPGSSSLNPSAYDNFAQAPVAVERGRQRFDDTAMRAVDRLASGMESLVTPQSEKWHGLAATDPLAPEESDEEKEYFERYRDYMFAVRYNPRSGFIGAHQKALRSAIALGTGISFAEENLGASSAAAPVLYRHLPLSQCYLAVDAQGEPDTLYRKFTMTARQMVQQFGPDKLADQVVRAAENQAEKDRAFTVIHAVQPRQETGMGAGSGGGTNRKAPFASFYLDRDHMKLIGESGFYEFPFIVYYWAPVDVDGPYAQSPVMLAMADIKGLNAIRKLSLRGLQGYMDPPWGVAHDGVMNRPNLNPGKINYRAVSQDGRQLIVPLQPGARPDFVNEILAAERQTINDSLYVSLFQILIQNPNMTATEAMIRANEKGELLGPAGGRIQIAMGRDVDRLAGIMERKGAMQAGSPLEPPDSLKGREFGARFTSPLDRLRRSQEGIGIQRTLSTVLPLAQVDPSVVDNFDLDAIARTVTEIEGAPHRILKTTEERDAARQAKQQMQQAQAALEMAKTGGEAAKNLMPAVGQAAAILGNGMAGAPE